MAAKLLQKGRIKPTGSHFMSIYNEERLVLRALYEQFRKTERENDKSRATQDWLTKELSSVVDSKTIKDIVSYLEEEGIVRWTHAQELSPGKSFYSAVRDVDRKMIEESTQFENLQLLRRQVTLLDTQNTMLKEALKVESGIFYFTSLICLAAFLSIINANLVWGEPNHDVLKTAVSIASWMFAALAVGWLVLQIKQSSARKKN